MFMRYLLVVLLSFAIQICAFSILGTQEIAGAIVIGVLSGFSAAFIVLLAFGDLT